ncbi:MAG: ribosome maturation factor RimM [Variibacter sp.]
MTRERRICVAQVGAPHGVRGEVRLKSFTEDPQAVARYGSLETEDGVRRFEIESLRPAKDMLVVRLRGVSDRNAAEALRNLRLYVPRDRLPPPEPGEFYHADLIGLAAVTADGEPFGKVVALHDFGAGDLIEIALAQGGATELLPFTAAVVPEVDIAAGRIVVMPPAEPSPLEGEGGSECSEEPDEGTAPTAGKTPHPASRPSGRSATLSHKGRG